MGVDYSKYTFFWKSKSPFSQWYPKGFTLDGLFFKTSEHYMMHGKAMLFRDLEKAKEILTVSSPYDVKKKGREVKNFKQDVWEANCKSIVYKGNHAKFTQNPELLKALMDTGDTELVEASPVDFVWGIGLDEAGAKKRDPKEWPGTNWLGEVLTKLKKDLKQN